MPEFPLLKKGNAGTDPYHELKSLFFSINEQII